MSEQQKGKGNDWLIPGVIIAASVLLTVMLFVVFTGFGQKDSAVPSVQAGGDMHAADPSDPMTIDMINQLRGYTDPKKMLSQLHGKTVQDWDAKFSLWKAHYNDPAVVKIVFKDDTHKRDKVQDYLDDASLQIHKFYALESAKDTTKNSAAIDAILTKLAVDNKAINELVGGLSGKVADVIKLGDQLIQRRKDTGSPTYGHSNSPMPSYSQIANNSFNPVSDAKTLDCSGFIWYILVANNVVKGNYLNTDGEIESRINFDHIDPSLIDGTGGGKKDNLIQVAELQNAFNNKVLKPGDLMVRTSMSGLGNHVVMIRSTDFDSDESVMESNIDSKGGGPAYRNMKRIASFWQSKGFAYESNWPNYSVVSGSVYFLRPHYQN